MEVARSTPECSYAREAVAGDLSCMVMNSSMSALEREGREVKVGWR